METQPRPALEREDEGNKAADRRYREAAVKHAFDHDPDWQEPLVAKPASAVPVRDGSREG